MSSNETSFSHQLPITDLIQLAGNEKLSGFVWGETVCRVLNTYLSTARQISLDTTGREASKLLNGLHMPALLQISQVSIDLSNGEIHYRRDRRADDPTLSNTHIALPPIPRPVPRPNPDTSKDGGTDAQNTHQKIMLFISGALVLVMLVLTFAVKDSHEHGKGPLESSLLETVVRTLGEVFRATAETAPKTPNPSSGYDPQAPHGPAADYPSEYPSHNTRPNTNEYTPEYN